MSKIYAVDIETCCDVGDCPGLGVWHKCAHALSAKTGRITQVGVWSPDEQHVFKDPYSFFDWYQLESRQIIGQNFKFDLKFLAEAGCILTEDWIGDTQLQGSLYEPKIPDSWLANYEQSRQELIAQLPKEESYKFRKGSKHSLKTMAPYYLGVEPFWEALGTEDAEYVLKDCEYTYRLHEYFLQRQASFDPFNFYETYMFPAEKFLLGVELRGLTLDLPQLEADRDAALKEIKQIENKLADIWVDAFGKWDDDQRVKIKAKYEKMLETAKEKKKSEVTILNSAKDILNSYGPLLQRLKD